MLTCWGRAAKFLFAGQCLFVCDTWSFSIFSLSFVFLLCSFCFSFHNHPYRLSCHQFCFSFLLLSCVLISFCVTLGVEVVVALAGVRNCYSSQPHYEWYTYIYIYIERERVRLSRNGFVSIHVYVYVLSVYMRLSKDGHPCTTQSFFFPPSFFAVASLSLYSSFVHTHVHAYTQTLSHTHIHTYTHTRTHTHMHRATQYSLKIWCCATLHISKHTNIYMYI